MRLLGIDTVFREAVEADLDRLYEFARAFADRNADLIDRLARRLVERRVLGGEEVRAIIADVGGRHA